MDGTFEEFEPDFQFRTQKDQGMELAVDEIQLRTDEAN